MQILKPYRDRIDALDDRIVDLLAERTGIIREVAQLKFREDIPAVLQDRVDQVRERAAARAAAKGMDPAVVREIYARLIAFSCNLEETIKAELAHPSPETAVV
jgi:chorismate mutase